MTLVLGAARSGKSAVAEDIAAACPPPVTYVATMCVGDDIDLAARVAVHQARRPGTWSTVEPGRDLAGALDAAVGTVLVDSLGPWVAAHDGDAVDAEAVCAVLRRRVGASVVVSEEVGWGVHPEHESGRSFRDELGRLNQSVAAVADVVLLVVAGRVLSLPPWAGSRPR